jgi:YHS domain-containing protein
MKNYLILSVFLMLSVTIILNCSSGDKTETEPAAQEQMMSEETIDISADMLTTTMDLTCEMDLTKHAITDTAIYKDQLYGFCSGHCKEKFLEDPEAAIAKLEGNQ